MKNLSLKDPSSKISNDKSSLSDSMQPDKSKSTTYIENKVSRITKSFITSTYSTSSTINNTHDLRYGGTFLKKDNFFNSTFTKNHITEFNDEDSISSKADKDNSQMITFSMLINKHSLLTKDSLPLILKESFEISSCEKLKKAIILFIRIANKSLKDKGVKLVIPKLNMLNNNDFQVKPMKKSGKPDFDLPAFDIESAIKCICSSCFALVFKESYLIGINNGNQSQSEFDSSKSEVKKSRDSIIKEDCLSSSKCKLLSEKNKEKDKSQVKKIEDNSCCNKCLVF